MRKFLSALALGTALASGWAWAQSAPVPDFSGRGGAGDLAWAGAALALVLAALALFLKLIQRFGRFRKAGRAAFFEMRGYQPLDNRKYLAAVAVDGRLLIIGVTPDRLIPLGQWPLRAEEADAAVFTLDETAPGRRPPTADEADEADEAGR
ncbi:MAG: flagellar biosynthetic protein FliO [Candidatus Adiutrix sp.]|jgi:flagellar biogenesis protein FliO|nr:flagellar biosynthetic protein FliO [Candidatus Adiutrix sp.]